MNPLLMDLEKLLIDKVAIARFDIKSVQEIFLGIETNPYFCVLNYKPALSIGQSP